MADLLTHGHQHTWWPLPPLGWFGPLSQSDSGVQQMLWWFVWTPLQQYFTII
jgi:hypothetical protein